jgi:XRE family aerobic/anaerobic benzoate catabolism transcriptional regulator
VGLRGAGKSTVGEGLAGRLRCPFHELDALVEARAGVRLAELFAGGEASRYRELERSVLGEVLARGSPCVIATGGSLVTDEATWAMLRASARTVWLRALPEDHLSRVEAQGDTRPMAGRADALAELRDILEARTPAYERAEARVDTHGIPVDAVVERIVVELALSFEEA